MSDSYYMDPSVRSVWVLAGPRDPENPSDDGVLEVFAGATPFEPDARQRVEGVIQSLRHGWARITWAPPSGDDMLYVCTVDVPQTETVGARYWLRRMPLITKMDA
jgi:hypothetical protein